MADDPFPRDRVATMLRRLPAYLRLSWRLTREPLLSRARRAAVLAAAGYLVSPIDLVPDAIPVLGQLDDIAVALAAIRLALAGLSPERRRLHLDAVGLGDEDLAADLRTLGATTAWVLRVGVRVAGRGVRVTGRGVRVAGRGAQAGVRAAAKGAALAARGSKAMAERTSAAGGSARSAAGDSARSASIAGRERLARLRARSARADTLIVEREGGVPETDPQGS